MTGIIPARLGLQQRMLPDYRAPFFEKLGAACKGGMGFFAGLPRPEEAVSVSAQLENAQFTMAHNYHLFTGAMYMCWQSGFIEWLEEWQPEVLVVEANPRYLQTPKAVRWMHERKRPVLGWGLGAPVMKGRISSLRAVWRKKFLAQFDGLIAYSRQGAREYAATGFPENRIFVAANSAVSCSDAVYIEKPLEQSGKRVIVYVGRLQERKRVDLLLQACAALDEPEQPHLWVVGSGPAQASLEKLAKRIYPQTKFWGPQHGIDLKNRLTAADLFVLPGTGGLAVQQAMSCGLPVIVAEADGTQTDLVREENGWVVQPGNLEMLVQVMRQALADIPHLRKMAQASYEIVLKEINLEKMIETFGSAVCSILEVV